MRDGAMVVLPWLVVSALVGVVVTGDNGVIGDLEFPGDAGITGDSKVTGDHTITHDAVIMGDVGVTGALVDTGYNWQDYFVSADTDPAFDEDTGGYEGEKGICPHGCNMCGSDGSVRTFLCGGQELKYVDDNEGSFMEVVCHNWRVPLNCSRLPPLPARRPGSFQRVEVTSCILPPTMPISCATGGEGTTELTLQKAASSVTADNVRGLDAEQLFFMFEPDGCREVPVEAIKVLPRLRSVRILQGTSLPLHGDMFLASPPLTMLEISMSGVKEIPSNAFRGLAQLKTLSLFLNKIAYVAEEAFNGLDSLEKLVLNDNPITSFPPRALPRTLRVLLLEKVPLSSLEEGVLEGLAHLQELSIDSRTNLTLGARAFSRLPSLTSLKLTRSGVTSLPPDLFAETPALLELILSYNRISSLQRQVFSPLVAVEKLDLSYNQISFVSSDIFLPLASLTNLNLDGNKIRSLPQYLFASLGNLTSVSLAHNQLTTILLDSFTAAGSIKHLSFSHNNLTWSASDAEYSSPFNSLLHLESLDLSHNGIGYVFSDWRYVLLHLKSLDLSYNKITSLTAADVQFFASVVVDLSHNHITEVVPGLVGSDTIEPSRTTLILNHNPFRCDCNLYHFLELVQSGDKKYSVDDATCSSPASVVHKPLRQVDMREATCAVPGVTAGCDCLTRPALNRTECICNNTRVPSIELTGFPEMYLRLTRLPTANDLLRLPAFVGTLNLTNLQLKHVPKLPDTIRTVDLSKNNIEKVPEQIWSRNITLKLAHNPLVCECSSTKQVKLIQTYNYSKISDYDNVTCFDGSLIKQKDWNALCDVYRSALAGTMFAVVLIFFAVIAALFYHYWIEIQVILYSRGWFLHLLPKEKIDSNKKYDVFVAFASEDEKFVLEEVLPRLSGYTLLVQDRDWIAGNTIPAEIHRSIEQSKRTLIILTSNFLKSKWAAEQFRTIHTQATNDKRLRAVVILLDVKKNELDRDTKTLLSLSTLLKYNESMFWDKVRYALPRKMYEYRQVKASLSEKGIALWKDAGAGLDVILSEEGKLVNKGFVKDIV